MLETAAVLTELLRLEQGAVQQAEPGGEVLVQAGDGDTTVSCKILRTSIGAFPELKAGDKVLGVFDTNAKTGYILGVVETYNPQKDPLDELSSKLSMPEDEVNIELPRKPKDVKVNGKRIVFEADHEIQLKCGKGSILMDRQGKIVIRGTNLISRSSGMNKIKGAAVNIN